MKTQVCSVAILMLLASPALAGRNANGALVVHADRSLAYTACDLPASQICGVTLPGSCEELVTQVGDDVPTIYILASFTDVSSPGVSAIRFGITHNLPTDDVFWPAATCWNPCGTGASEVPDADWPVGGVDGRSGNTVGFSTPIHDRFIKFYCFVLEGIYYDGGSYFFATSSYSETEPALFYDDATPPNTDVCTSFGVVRWLQPGANQCPQDTLGACCLEDGACAVVSGEQCAAQNGTFQGYFTSCNSTSCAQPEACCLTDGQCLFLPGPTCESLGGTPQGGGSTCDPNPCEAFQACCYSDGGCLLTAPAICRQGGGLPSGPGTTCDPNPCPQPRACCLPDGRCELRTPLLCVGDEGVPHDEFVCEPDPCVLGACCLSTACAVYSSAACAVHHGIFMGDGTLCEPNPCVSAMEDAAAFGPIRLSASPNPSSGPTEIQYNLPRAGDVTLEVFSASGCLVRRLSGGFRRAGLHEVRWDGRGDDGRELPTGVYFLHGRTAGARPTARLVLTR